MKIKYLKDAAGIAAGTENDLPENIAVILIERGIVEELKSAPKKEAKVEVETKEEKTTSKRRTKTKK